MPAQPVLEPMGHDLGLSAEFYGMDRRDRPVRLPGRAGAAGAARRRGRQTPAHRRTPGGHGGGHDPDGLPRRPRGRRSRGSRRPGCSRSWCRPRWPTPPRSRRRPNAGATSASDLGRRGRHPGRAGRHRHARRGVGLAQHLRRARGAVDRPGGSRPGRTAPGGAPPAARGLPAGPRLDRRAVRAARLPDARAHRVLPVRVVRDAVEPECPCRWPTSRGG